VSRRYALAALLVAGLLVAAGTGGFTVTTAQRGAEISVAPDGQAYLDVRTADRSLDAGTATVGLVALENRFPSPLDDVEVSIGSDGPEPPTLRGYDAPDGLRSGASGTVTATAVCDPRNETTAETWTVWINASGPAVAVNLARSVTVSCEAAPMASNTTAS
jgi:hypothetical protein